MTDILETTLGEIACGDKRSVISGPFGSNISRKYFVDEGVPVIRGGNLTDDLTRFVAEDFVICPTFFVRYVTARNHLW